MKAHPRTRGSVRRTLDVILADDDPADNLLFTLAVNDANVDLHLSFAVDGEDLLRVLRERVALASLPDVVVLDIRMPGCSGLEAMEMIAASPELRDLPVVMFTTSRREADMRRGLELGVFRFETKPSTYAELVSFVAELDAVIRARACDTAVVNH